MDKKRERAIVLFSGGQDSTTILYWAKQNFTEIIAVTFDYHQKNRNEIFCAKEICDRENIKHEIIVLNEMNLLRTNIDKDGTIYKNYINGRNFYFLTFASLYAVKENVTNMVIGISQIDAINFPDCNFDFIESFGITLSLATNHPVHIHTPLINMKKEEIWKLSYDLGIIDIIKTKTLTCYEGVIGEGCGSCSACLKREVGYNIFYESLRG